MSENNSVQTISAVAEDSAIDSHHGIQKTDATLPVNSDDKYINIESYKTRESQPFQRENSTYLENVSVHTTEALPRTKITTSLQLPKATDNQNSKEADRSDRGLQYLSLFLKFLEQQITSQLPLFFFGTLVFICAAILISQASEGIRIKLDLEVSQPSNPVERIQRK